MFLVAVRTRLSLSGKSTHKVEDERRKRRIFVFSCSNDDFDTNSSLSGRRHALRMRANHRPIDARRHSAAHRRRHAAAQPALRLRPERRRPETARRIHRDDAEVLSVVLGRNSRFGRWIAVAVGADRRAEFPQRNAHRSSFRRRGKATASDGERNR